MFTPFQPVLISIWGLASQLRGQFRTAIYPGKALLGEVVTDANDLALDPNRLLLPSLVIHHASRTFEMQNHGPQVAGVIIALLTLSIAAVSVRCYVRNFITKSFGYDDWLIVATLVRIHTQKLEMGIY